MAPADHAHHAPPGLPPPAAAVVLAGGLARRMGGGDKALRGLGGRMLLDHVLARIAPQAARVALSANGDAARFGAWGLAVLPDPELGGIGPERPGPLAGILAGLLWAGREGFAELLVVPTDTPFLPPDLLARLRAGRGAAVLACAESEGRLHPVVSLWPVGLAGPLEAALRAGERRVVGWMRSQGLAAVRFPTEPDGDPFANLNTPDDLAAAEARLAQREARATLRKA